MLLLLLPLLLLLLFIATTAELLDKDLDKACTTIADTIAAVFFSVKHQCDRSNIHQQRITITQEQGLVVIVVVVVGRNGGVVVVEAVVVVPGQPTTALSITSPSRKGICKPY